jgi:hypothetical protein
MVRGRQTEVQLAGRIEQPFGERRWTLEVNPARLSLDELVAQLAALKPGFSPALRCDGEAQATLQIAGPIAAWKGTLAVPAGATLRVPGVAQPVELSDLRLRYERGRVSLEPLTVRFAPDSVLAMSGELQLDDPQLPFRWRWKSAQVQLEPLERTTEALGWEVFRQARWQGRAQFDLESRGRLRGPATGPWPDSGWQGSLELRDARLQPAEFNHPLEIPVLRLAWKGAAAEAQPLVLRLGENNLSVSAQRGRPGEAWNFTLAGARLRLADLNDLVNPAQRGFFERLARSDARPAPIGGGKGRRQDSPRRVGCRAVPPRRRGSRCRLERRPAFFAGASIPRLRGTL